MCHFVVFLEVTYMYQMYQFYADKVSESDLPIYLPEFRRLKFYPLNLEYLLDMISARSLQTNGASPPPIPAMYCIALESPWQLLLLTITIYSFSHANKSLWLVSYILIVKLKLNASISSFQ